MKCRQANVVRNPVLIVAHSAHVHIETSPTWARYCKNLDLFYFVTPNNFLFILTQLFKNLTVEVNMIKIYFSTAGTKTFNEVEHVIATTTLICLLLVLPDQPKTEFAVQNLIIAQPPNPCQSFMLDSRGCSLACLPCQWQPADMRDADCRSPHRWLQHWTPARLSTASPRSGARWRYCPTLPFHLSPLCNAFKANWCRIYQSRLAWPINDEAN